MVDPLRQGRQADAGSQPVGKISNAGVSRRTEAGAAFDVTDTLPVTAVATVFHAYGGLNSIAKEPPWYMMPRLLFQGRFSRIRFIDFLRRRVYGESEEDGEKGR